MIKNKNHFEASRLFLRLPSDSSQPLLWMLASPETSQYGSVEAGGTDLQLTSLLTRYSPWVLVSASEITFHQVTLPHRSRRQCLRMLPFLLEEQLASDIENLHFAILEERENICYVAVVEKVVMQGWLTRCEQLGVRDHMFLPDVLMLPLSAEGWSAVSLNDQWLLRSDAYSGMVVESSWLPQLLAISSPSVIESYSTPPTHTMGIEWRQLPERDILQLAAEREEYKGDDLRQGEFSRRGSLYARIHPWRSVMFSLIAYVLLLLCDAGISHYRLWQQAENWKQVSINFYRQLFPDEKNVINPRVQMMNHLQQLPVNSQPDMSAEILQLQQLLTETSTIRLQTLRWDSNRKELIIDLQAESFQVLEQFLLLAGKKYQLQPGEVRQNNEGVESRIILGITDE